MAADISRLLAALTLSDEPVVTLEELKTAVYSVHPSALENVVGNISFQVVFTFLNSKDGEQLQLSCDILSRLLTAIGPQAVVQNFYEEIHSGLSHPAVPVKCLCLQQVKDIGVNAVDELLTREDLLHQVIRLIGNESLAVAKLAADIVLCLGNSPQGLTALFTSTLLQTLQQVMSVSDTVRFRVYELLIKICQVSVVALEHTHESGALQQLLNELHKDDILVQLNCIELLSDMAITEHCLVYLDQQGVVNKLDNMLSSTQSDPLAGLLLPGLIKFFGGVARFHPKEVCSGKEIFMNIVLDNTASNDQTMNNIAVQTVGFIASTPEGKVALDKWGGKLKSAISNIGAVVRNASTEFRINALQAVENLLHLEVPDQTSELLTMTERWFGLLSHNSLQMLLDIAQQPFTDLRCAVYRVFVAIATQQWGQECMNKHPGFNEFLLDRSTETTKEGKDAKYELIKTLAESPFVVNTFGNPYYVKLKAYCVQGSIYVRAQAEVAIEGD